MINVGDAERGREREQIKDECVREREKHIKKNKEGRRRKGSVRTREEGARRRTTVASACFCRLALILLVLTVDLD